MGGLVALGELAERVRDGDSVALGGSFAHRFPGALVRELVRRGRRELELVKPSPGYDLDLLVRGGALRRARVGIAAMDEGLGLLPSYRAAVEGGALELEEHSCATILAGLRAAAAGVPYMPVAGLEGSDIPALNGWARLPGPYGEGGPGPYVVPAIAPDVAVVHAHAVDPSGNARVLGSPYWDRAITRAARRVLVTAERLVEPEELRRRPELTLAPGFMVEAAAVVPGGAWPGSVYPDRGVDVAALRSYMEPGEAALRRHLESAPEVGDAVAA